MNNEWCQYVTNDGKQLIPTAIGDGFNMVED